MRGEQSFVGAPLGARNPTRELLLEAGTAFGGDTRVAQIISIGCGTPHLLSLEELRGESGLGRLVKEMAVDCQMVAKDLSTRFRNVEAYLRLDVEAGVGGTEFDDWSVLGEIDTHTSIYIGSAPTTTAIDASVHRVQTKIGTTTLGRLSTHIAVVLRCYPDLVYRPIE
jgi:hypothetical protein